MNYLNIQSLKDKLNRSINSIYVLVDQGHLPKPVKLGGKNVWREDLIDKAIEKLATEQNAGWESLLETESE